MAIIRDDEDQINSANPPPKSQPEKPNPPSASSPPNRNRNPFSFWFYFTLTVSLLTLLFVFISSLTSQDPKTWFLSLPTSLRAHYSKGRIIKAQINPYQSPVEVFTYLQGPKTSESLLIVHGLGCSSFTFRKIVDHIASKGVFAVAIDLPGSGFSDKAVVEEGEKPGGVLGRFLDVYDEIREKGLFWGFDNLVEHGYIPYEENIKVRVSTRKSFRPLELGSEEVGRVLGQVIDSLGLAPLHLVFHDSALLLGAKWVLENAGSLRSLTLVDTMPRGVALPLWAFEMPLVREVVLRFDFMFRMLINSCCSKSIDGSNIEAHRSLLTSSNGRQAIVGMGKKLNYSFDLAEWANSGTVKSVPIQVLWSSSWSKEWNEEGRQVAEAIPQAKFVTHSGGLWSQDDASNDEVAGNIVSFVASLPKTVRQAEEPPQLPEHIQKMFEEANNNDDQHQHDHDGHSHPDGHAHAHSHASYNMDAYGFGHGWGS